MDFVAARRQILVNDPSGEPVLGVRRYREGSFGDFLFRRAFRSSDWVVSAFGATGCVVAILGAGDYA